MLRTVAFCTLGCRLNFAETSTISRFFIDRGFKIVPYHQKADFYVLNSCSVTANANKKGRNAIARAYALNPQATIIVTGCYAQLKSEEVANLQGVKFVFGVNNKAEIGNIIDAAVSYDLPFVSATPHNEMKSFFPAFSKGDRTRAFLKVQDGCDYFCAYCTIPFARGRSRNQSIADCVKQVQLLANEGMKEVVISGVNIGDFGKSTGENFLQLLTEIVKIDGIERFRIGSIEPDLLTDEMIHFIANEPKIMPHFHIPLQTGSNLLLKLIGRHYDTYLYKHKIELIKTLIPSAFIGIDLIVGVNGETQAMFDETVEFVKSLDISFIHHFQYSERENTRALKFTPRTTPAEKKNRSQVITQISNEKHAYFVKQQFGNQFNVLFESTRKAGKMFGFTENYIRVAVDYDKNLVNKITTVKLNEIIDSETVSAVIVN